MAQRQLFLRTEWSIRWQERYAELTVERRRSCDEAALSLIKKESSPGLRIRPIQPEKYYFEARINSGDRIIFRIEAGTIFFIDIVKHDDIGRYGRRSRPR
jgi:hypothetical protein